MKLIFRALLVFILYIFNISYAFSKEDEIDLHFPEVKDDIVLNDYKHYTGERILELVDKKTKSIIANKFVAKHTFYEYKNILPKVEGQNFIYSDGDKVWLELTNFEFIIDRNKESNKIVTVYIGNVGNKNKATRHEIEIFDPEAVFVFQDKIIRFWDMLSEDDKKNAAAKIVEMLQKGYAAISYHFAFAHSLDSSEQKLLNIQNIGQKEILDFYNVIHQKYIKESQIIGRLVTKNDIKKNKSIGFTAYYPNPIYLDDIVWYERPIGMSYREYVEKSKEDIRFVNFFINLNCDKEYLSKYSDINYDRCDKYDPILLELYPDMTYINSTKLCYSDFERKSVYAFRGDERSPDEIHDDGGFWNSIHKYSSDKSKWLIENHGSEYYSTYGTYYVATSKIATAANFYGSYTYVTFVVGGLSLPYKFGDRHIQDIGTREISAPEMIDWENGICRKFYKRPAYISSGYNYPANA